MNWTRDYIPSEKTIWQGRQDVSRNAYYFQVMQLLDLTHQPEKNTEGPGFALLGFQCDAGIARNLGRTGAAQGPDNIRACLAKLAIPATDVTYYDAGDIICRDDGLEAAQAALAETIALLLNQKLTPIVLGGGHELAYGHYLGLANQHQRLAIVNFDAHFDMRPLMDETRGNSGTPFLQIAETCKNLRKSFHYYCLGVQPASNTNVLFETAKAHQVQYLLADDFHLAWHKTEQMVKQIIADYEAIYISVCLDVFASAFAPGVSAPQPLGVLPWQIVPLLRQLSASGKVVSYDIAELSPPYDVDQRTAKLAAYLIDEIMRHHRNLNS